MQHSVHRSVGARSSTAARADARRQPLGRPLGRPSGKAPGQRKELRVVSEPRIAEVNLEELAVVRDTTQQRPAQTSAFVCGLGRDELSTSGFGHSQMELAEVLSRKILSGDIICCPNTVAPTLEEQAAKARRMFEATKIKSRSSRFPPERYFEYNTEILNAQGACQEQFLVPRLQAAAQAALEQWESRGGQGGAQAITHLIVGGLTAPRSSPGPDASLAHRLGLAPNCNRVPLHHLGCLGGYRALSIAADIARGNPHARVLVAYGDVSSLIGASLQSPMNEADLLSIAVFTDGAAGAVVCGEAAAEADGAAPLLRVALSRSDVISNVDATPTYDQMWLRESFFRSDGSIVGENFVGKGVPKHLLRRIAPFVERLLLEHSGSAGTPPLNALELPLLCHPGGPAILDSIRKALGLSEWQLEHSWRVLAARGNMSGATNLHVLQSFVEGGCLMPDGRRAPHALGLAFGPGLAVEGLVFDFDP